MIRPTLEDSSAIAELCRTLLAKSMPSPLVEELERFNSRLGSSPKREENFRLLKNNALTVITGQQVGLFGGPLLTMYKIITCVSLAQTLTRQLQRPVVPVFWIQSEDHDLEEIASAPILKSDGTIQVLTPLTETENQLSVSQVKLPDLIKHNLEQIEVLLPPSTNRDFILKLLSEAYQPEVSWSDAFAKFMGNVFADEGIIFFDPQNSGLREHVNTVYQEIALASLEKSAEIEKLLETTTTKLEKNGKNVVKLRPKSPLFFVAEESGARYRIQQSGPTEYSLIGRAKSITTEELKRIISTSPSRITTSALLRPLLQDKIFPTIAYVGGEAELQYHQQIEDLYPLFGATLPALVPRLKCSLMGPKAKSALAEVGLGPANFAKPVEEIFSLIPGRKAEASRAETVGTITAIFERLEKELADQTLRDPLRKTKDNVTRAFEMFYQKLSKAELNQNEVIIRRIARIKNSLFPLDQPQERVLAVGGVLARTGFSIKKRLLDFSLAYHEQIKPIKFPSTEIAGPTGITIPMEITMPIEIAMEVEEL